MDDQRRHVDLLQVFTEISLGKGLDALQLVLQAALHALEPEGVPHTLGDLVALAVGAEERDGQVLEELGTVGKQAGADVVEHRHGLAGGVGLGLQHERRHRTQQHDLGDAGRLVAAKVADDLAPAGRVTDQGHLAQVEFRHQFRQVVGIGVHVVAAPGLVGSPVTAAIMGNAAEAMGSQVRHLILPGVGRERPAMAENNGFALTPILVRDLRVVPGRDRSHSVPPVCGLRGAPCAVQGQKGVTLCSGAAVGVVCGPS